MNVEDRQSIVPEADMQAHADNVVPFPRKYAASEQIDTSEEPRVFDEFDIATRSLIFAVQRHHARRREASRLLTPLRVQSMTPRPAQEVPPKAHHHSDD